jgi:hypothetical protein
MGETARRFNRYSIQVLFEIEKASKELFLFIYIPGVCENSQELRHEVHVVWVGSSPIDLSGPEKVHEASQRV